MVQRNIKDLTAQRKALNQNSPEAGLLTELLNAAQSHLKALPVRMQTGKRSTCVLSVCLCMRPVCIRLVCSVRA